MANKDYYKILQVDPSAEPEVIAGAYRRLALKYHPDTNKSVDSRRMQEINEACEVLSDPAKRQEYDRERLRKRQEALRRSERNGRSSESRTSGERLVYQSDFYHPPPWLESVGENYRSFCRDGYFHMAIQTPYDYWWRYQCFTTAGEDFRVDVEAQFAANTGEDSECGIVFRRQEDGSFYCFTVHPFGYYQLGARRGSSWEILLDWRFSEFLRRGSAVNALAVMATRSRIELRANGYLLSAFEDTTSCRGEAGAFVAARDHYAEARFRDFRLYSLVTGDYQRADSWTEGDREKAEHRNTSRCPNCGAPVSKHYGFAGGEWVRVLICESCGWSY